MLYKTVFIYLYDMSHTFVYHVITTGSRVVLQAAVENAACYEVEVDDEHKRQLMTILETSGRRCYCVIYYLLLW